MAVIYMAINTKTNRSYIGKTVGSMERRRQIHYSQARKRYDDTYFHRAIRKYGENVFDWIILEDASREELANAERFWIAYFRSIGAELYNMTNGGDGALGRKLSEKNRARLSALHKGNKYGLGKRASDETRQKLSAMRRGKKQSDEHVLNRSKTYILCSPDGVLTTITNLAAFCREHGYDQSSMCKLAKGKKKRMYGWAYIEAKS